MILLHGGLGHSNNWGYQVPALVRNGYRAILLNSRGHGRSTRDSRPFTYELMASDVLAEIVHRIIGLRSLHQRHRLEKFIELVRRGREQGVVLLMSGQTSIEDRIGFANLLHAARVHVAAKEEHARSARGAFAARIKPVHAPSLQPTSPAFSTCNASRNEIRMPVVIVQSEHDEFIKPEHAEHLARSIPNAELVVLPGVSHFAPLQRQTYSTAQCSHSSARF